MKPTTKADDGCVEGNLFLPAAALDLIHPNRYPLHKPLMPHFLSTIRIEFLMTRLANGEQVVIPLLCEVAIMQVMNLQAFTRLVAPFATTVRSYENPLTLFLPLQRVHVSVVAPLPVTRAGHNTSLCPPPAPAACSWSICAFAKLRAACESRD